jgi:Leucine-rich repeat (LRR) protein
MTETANPMPDVTADRPPRRRRWIPLSLRMFVLIVALVGVSSALCCGVPACRQWMASREVERLGGTVSIEPTGPNWLYALTGGRKTMLFEKAVGLSKLETLSLEDTAVTDAGLAHLAALTNLTSVSLGNSRVTDLGLAHFNGLTKLAALRLNDTQVTDAGLAQLEGLTRLNRLELSNSRVTDAGLAHLAALTKLEILRLDGTHITDAGLANLKGLTGLRSLLVWKTEVTDSGVADLSRSLPQLNVVK